MLKGIKDTIDTIIRRAQDSIILCKAAEHQAAGRYEKATDMYLKMFLRADDATKKSNYLLQAAIASYVGGKLDKARLLSRIGLTYVKDENVTCKSIVEGFKYHYDESNHMLEDLARTPVIKLKKPYPQQDIIPDYFF